MERDKMKLSHLQSGPQLLSGDWARSLLERKEYESFRAENAEHCLKKIHKLEVGQCLCQTNMQKRVIKKGQDLTLNFYPELHKDYNSNRMKM